MSLLDEWKNKIQGKMLEGADDAGVITDSISPPLHSFHDFYRLLIAYLASLCHYADSLFALVIVNR